MCTPPGDLLEPGIKPTCYSCNGPTSKSGCILRSGVRAATSDMGETLSSPHQGVGFPRVSSLNLERSPPAQSVSIVEETLLGDGPGQGDGGRPQRITGGLPLPNQAHSSEAGSKLFFTESRCLHGSLCPHPQPRMRPAQRLGSAPLAAVTSQKKGCVWGWPWFSG